MRRSLPPIAFVLAAALCAPAPSALAQIYKWEDAQGRLHFSSEPPPAGAKSLGTVDTSRSKAREEAAPEADESAPEAEAEPPVARPGRLPGRTASAEAELQNETFELGEAGFTVSVAVPSYCRRSRMAQEDPTVIAFYECGQPNEPREAALAIVMNRETTMSQSEVASACRSKPEYLLRVANAVLSETVTIREASCDAERHKLLMSGTYRQRQDLPEAQLALVPTTEGVLAAVALWRKNARPGTTRAMRVASQSATVPDEFLVWPREGGGFLEELSAAMSADQSPAARRAQQQAADVQRPAELISFLFGLIGLFKLYSIVHSDELAPRAKRPR